MSTTTTGKVAIELRRLADAMEINPDVEIEKPWMTFYCHDKANFISSMKLLPRPLVKSVSGSERFSRVRVEYISPAIDINASVPQSITCELVEPAKPAVYRCDPILSLDEMDEVAR